jgi:tetratricopeptide (TPR) repeat protein
MRSLCEVLNAARRPSVIVQDWTPLRESLLWELGRRFYAAAGTRAFQERRCAVPFGITSDGGLADRAARVLFAKLVRNEESGIRGRRVTVLELGCGSGLFARQFLDSIRELSTLLNIGVYERFWYICSDASLGMLDGLRNSQVLAEHEGHYSLVRGSAVDAAALMTDGHPADGTDDGTCDAVIANYLMDSLPSDVLQVAEDGTPQRLWARIAAEPPANGAVSTDNAPEEWVNQKCHDNGAHLAWYRAVHGTLSTEYCFVPFTRGVDSYLDHALDLIERPNTPVMVNSDALACLHSLVPAMKSGTHLMITDYPDDAMITAGGDAFVQVFGGAVASGVNFDLCAAYASTHSLVTIAPLNEHAYLKTRLIAAEVDEHTRATFMKLYDRAHCDWVDSPVLAARELASTGRTDEALASYVDAVRRQPRNWVLLEELAVFLMCGMEDYHAAAECARRAVKLNPHCSADLWCTLGHALHHIGAIPEASDALRRSLSIDRAHVGARFHLANISASGGAPGEALRGIADALHDDVRGEWRDRLLRLQTDIITRVQSEHERMESRVRSRIARIVRWTEEGAHDNAGGPVYAATDVSARKESCHGTPIRAGDYICK